MYKYHTQDIKLSYQHYWINLLNNSLIFMDLIIILTIIIGVLPMSSNGANNNFDQNYAYLWGTDHFSVNPQGTEVQLKMDKSSG